MDRDSIDRLKLDQRLIRRRGWIADDELQRALADLPDAADKIAPAETPSEGSEAEATPASDASQPPSPQ